MNKRSSLDMFVLLSSRGVEKSRTMLAVLEASGGSDIPDVRWFRNVISVADYVSSNGTLPSRVGAVRQDDIGRWLNSEREKFQRGTLDPRKKIILDSLVRGWDKVRSTNRVVNLLNSIDAVSSYRFEHGRLPKNGDEAEHLKKLRLAYSRNEMPLPLVSMADSRMGRWRVGLSAGVSRP